MTKSRAFGAALGFGLLYAWMETLAVRLAILSGRGPSPGAPLFFACLALTLFTVGASSLQPFIERFRMELSVAGCVLMSSTPVALAAAGFPPFAPLLRRDFRDAPICASLFISRNTLKYHLRNIYRKTEAGNRRELRDVVGRGGAASLRVQYDASGG